MDIGYAIVLLGMWVGAAAMVVSPKSRFEDAAFVLRAMEAVTLIAVIISLFT